MGACVSELRFVSVYAWCLCGVWDIACLIISCSYMLEYVCVLIDTHYSSTISQIHAYMHEPAFVFYMLASLRLLFDTHYSSAISQVHAYMCERAFVFS